jgi:hypothetical protein
MYKDLNCSNCKNARLSLVQCRNDGPGQTGLFYCSRISEEPTIAAKVPTRNWCSWHDPGAPLKGPVFVLPEKVERYKSDQPNMVSIPLRLVNLRRVNRLRKLLRYEKRMAKAWDHKYLQVCEAIQFSIQKEDQESVDRQRQIGDRIFKRCVRQCNRVERLQAMLNLEAF